jgi:FkbM family methyltransferase
VGNSGKVIAFEPNPSNLNRLHRGIMLNGTKNVDVRAQAVSDNDGALAFYESESSLMGGILPVESALALTVPGTRLDTVAAESGPPNVIKVDVEGAEVAVLRGARQLLITHHPVLILELLTDSSRDAAAQLLNGWQFDKLDSRNWLVHLR